MLSLILIVLAIWFVSAIGVGILIGKSMSHLENTYIPIDPKPITKPTPIRQELLEELEIAS